MIEGCLEWQHSGLAPPAVVRKATEDYLDAEDTQAVCMAECCRVGPEQQDTTANLYASWKRWAEMAGEFVGSLKTFSQGMEKRGMMRKRQAGGLAGFAGIAVRPGIGVD